MPLCGLPACSMHCDTFTGQPVCRTSEVPVVCAADVTCFTGTPSLNARLLAIGPGRAKIPVHAQHVPVELLGNGALQAPPTTGPTLNTHQDMFRPGRQDDPMQYSQPG